MRLTILWTVALGSILTLPICHAQDASSSQASAASGAQEVVAGNDADLNRIKANLERKINDANDALRAWSTILAFLQQAKSSISTAKGPDQDSLTKIDQAIKAKRYEDARLALQIEMRKFDSLVAASYPNLPQQQNDPAVFLFISNWQKKITDLSFSLTTPEWDLLRQSYSQSSETRLSAGTLSAAMTQVSKFDDFRMRFNSLFDGLIADASAEQKKKVSELDTLTKESDRVSAQLAKSKTEINQLAIQLGLPLFCGTVLLMLCFPILVQSRSRGDNGASKQVDAIFGSGILVEIITVLLLTMSVLILGLAGKLQGEVLGTLLGGISGYVLNRFRDKPKSNAAPPDSSPKNG